MKVEVAVLGSRSLIVLMISVDVNNIRSRKRRQSSGAVRKSRLAFQGSPSLIVQGSPSLIVQGSPSLIVQGSPSRIAQDSPSLIVQGSPSLIVQGSPSLIVLCGRTAALNLKAPRVSNPATSLI